MWLWFEKNYFIKSIFDWGWFGIYIYLVKTVVEIEIEEKIVKYICLNKYFLNWGYKVYIYILILKIFNLNIIDLTIAIILWNK